MEHVYEISLIATSQQTDEHTVIQFKASGRDAGTLIHAYCKGVADRVQVTIIVEFRHYTASAGHYVKNHHAVMNHLFNGDY